MKFPPAARSANRQRRRALSVLARRSGKRPRPPMTSGMGVNPPLYMLVIMAIFMTLGLLRGNSGAVEAASGIATGCVHWRSEVTYSGPGFEQRIYLDNRCDSAKRCDIRTSADAPPLSVVVDAGTTRVVSSTVEAPEAEFKTDVSCH